MGVTCTKAHGFIGKVVLTLLPIKDYHGYLKLFREGKEAGIEGRERCSYALLAVLQRIASVRLQTRCAIH